MNSNECLNAILDMLNYEQVDECDKKGLLRTIKQDLERLEKENQELLKSHLQLKDSFQKLCIEYLLLKKELKQTKSNFKNSQTHSKKCFKKLKVKYQNLKCNKMGEND